MTLNFTRLDSRQVDAAREHYEEHGYFLLENVEEAITSRFFPEIASIIGAPVEQLGDLFDCRKPLGVLPPEVRQKLSRIQTSDALANNLTGILQPVIRALIGPIVQVSSSFHAQFKGVEVKAVDHGGYGSDYLEVHGAYLLHQDFTGANIPTSPSAFTLWLPLNTTRDWNLRLFPGSHRLGMLCNRWVGLNDPGLERLNAPIDIPAKLGTAVVFNAMMLHGTSNPGPLQRISCDIRFFPLCGFLPSQPRAAGTCSVEDIRELLAAAPGPVLSTPLFETLLYLRAAIPPHSATPHSALNWVDFIDARLRGASADALAALERFANIELGWDPPEVYTSKFHQYPLHHETMERAQAFLKPAARAYEIARQ